MGFEVSFKAEMAKREVSQLAVQPRVLVRRVRDCAAASARYGSRVAGVRLRWEAAIVGGCIRCVVVISNTNSVVWHWIIFRLRRKSRADVISGRCG